MDKLSIFIIGPMGGKNSPGSLSQHTHEIKAGTEIALKNLKISKKEFEIKIPGELAGSAIVDDVFHEIDVADLAIADISNRSPNVFYEIAYFDALGTPMIIFDSAGTDGETNIPFYWSQARIHQLDAFESAEIAKTLEGIFSHYFSPTSPIDLTGNPISRFYGVPLVDVSAASGLAVGYFDNYLQHVLKEKEGALAKSANKLKSLLVVRPTRVDSFQEDDDAVAAAFPNATNVTAEVSTHRRGAVYLPRVDNGLVIDLPTPLYSLQQAPRYKMLRKRAYKFQKLNKNVRDSILRRLEEKMIRSFFDTVEFLIEENPGVSGGRMEVKSVAELGEMRD